MVSGMMDRLNKMDNEIWVILIGLRAAFGEKREESWVANRSWGSAARTRRMEVVCVQKARTSSAQLKQRDKNLMLRKRVIVESENRLVRYLAEDGATNRDSLVWIYRPFGRMRQLWHLNMGVGFIGKGFMLVDEEDYEEQQ